ncbi:hypothetical protein [Paraburkholderia terricola]|uniref:hypothetical protein n=1 Tax=Paraburkholderia terricola TaxID=169427 RepID=UPI003ECE24FE
MKKIRFIEWAFAIALLVLLGCLFYVFWTAVESKPTPKWDWTAVGSIATAIAIFVALINAQAGIRDQRQHRRTEAEGLRAALRKLMVDTEDIIQKLTSGKLKEAYDSKNLKFVPQMRQSLEEMHHLLGTASLDQWVKAGVFMEVIAFGKYLKDIELVFVDCDISALVDPKIKSQLDQIGKHIAMARAGLIV